MHTSKKTAIIACDVLEEEVRTILKEETITVEKVVYLPMGKHDYPDLLNKDLKAALKEMENDGIERIIFVYGLCSNSILNVSSKTAELIFPRAHDCITLLLGSKERYAEIQKNEPGTYWFSPGWCRGKRVPGKNFFKEMEARFREQFDEDEVDYLMEMEQAKYAHYKCAAFTELDCADAESALAETKASASDLGMEFVHHKGDSGLLRRLLRGPWSEEEFLVLNPGQSAAYSGDETILKCAGCGSLNQ